MFVSIINYGCSLKLLRVFTLRLECFLRYYEVLSEVFFGCTEGFYSVSKGIYIHDLVVNIN